MPAPLEDVEALFAAVKSLRDERRKMERLSEKARNAPLGKSQKSGFGSAEPFPECLCRPSGPAPLPQGRLP